MGTLLPKRHSHYLRQNFTKHLAVETRFAEKPSPRHILNMALRSFSCLVLLILCSGRVSADSSHAIAMHGVPKYHEGFSGLEYANPAAKKGGAITLSKVGTFDNLNPFIIRGIPAEGRNLTFETLMARVKDEPFSLYGLLAKSIQVPKDRSWVIFTLNPKARFQDGRPVTVQDVIFSLVRLRDQGRPNHHHYYSQVERAENLGDGRVKFTLNKTNDRELPLILGLMPVLPKHHFESRAFDEISLAPIPGSGPYKVTTVDPGRSITYTRDPDYWGAALPINQGLFNFDRVRYDYYRDDATALEAFKAGLVDLREEYSPARWGGAYAGPAERDGKFKLVEIPHGRPAGMLGAVFNTRRPVFTDRRVRRALVLAFDFEWMNRKLFFGAYTRTQSYFENSELAAPLVPDAAERSFFAGLGALEREEVKHSLSPLPRSDGRGHNRANLEAAQRLLGEAGWNVVDGQLQNLAGESFTFEILLANPTNLRVSQQFSRDLSRLGIKAEVRQIDSAQYIERQATYDYDMLIYFWGQSLSPGNEQSFYWGADSAEQHGTRNYMGASDPLIDKIIGKMTAARAREDLVVATHALDRVLRTGDYVIPLYHLSADRIAYWDRFGMPEVISTAGYAIETWWADNDKVRTLVR